MRVSKDIDPKNPAKPRDVPPEGRCHLQVITIEQKPGKSDKDSPYVEVNCTIMKHEKEADENNRPTRGMLFTQRYNLYHSNEKVQQLNQGMILQLAYLVGATTEAEVEKAQDADTDVVFNWAVAQGKNLFAELERRAVEKDGKKTTYCSIRQGCLYAPDDRNCVRWPQDNKAIDQQIEDGVF